MALGVAVAPGKTEGPLTRFVFLGMEIDALSMSYYKIIYGRNTAFAY